MRRWKRTLSWRRRRALRSARMLDEMVDAQVATVPLLPEDVRPRAVEQLAQLVLLAQVYRRFSAGWIAQLDDRSGVRRATHRA